MQRLLRGKLTTGTVVVGFFSEHSGISSNIIDDVSNILLAKFDTNKSKFSEKR